MSIQNQNKVIKKVVVSSFTGSSDFAKTLGDDLNNARETVNEQFGEFGTIDHKFELNLRDDHSNWIDIIFTVTFTTRSLNLLKLKNRYIYELLEDI